MNVSTLILDGNYSFAASLTGGRALRERTSFRAGVVMDTNPRGTKSIVRIKSRPKMMPCMLAPRFEVGFTPVSEFTQDTRSGLKE